MSVYLCAKFEVSSIILASLDRGGGNFTTLPRPTSIQIPKKPTKIRVKKVVEL